MSGGTIHFENVGRRFGRRWVLRGLELDVQPGSVCGLLGRNGAGKTTLLRIACGLLRPHEGSVRIAGLDPLRDPVGLRRAIGFAGPDLTLPSAWTVQRTLDFGARAYADWNTARADHLRQRFALDARARVRDLSTGERAKLVLLLPLVRRPHVLLLDEPFGGLDIAVRREVLDGVIDILPDSDCTVLLTSHLVHELERLADHVAILAGHDIAFCGSPEDLLADVRRVVVRSPARPALDPKWDWVRRVEPWGEDWVLTTIGAAHDRARELASAGLDVRQVEPAVFEDAAHAHLVEPVQEAVR